MDDCPPHARGTPIISKCVQDRRRNDDDPALYAVRGRLASVVSALQAATLPFNASR